MPAPTVPEPALLLRAHGLRVTKQRLAVMSTLAQRPHAAAEAVISAVRGEVGQVSTQAVYDVLNTLTDRGILRRIQPAGSTARYELRVGDNHHHLVCRRCGSVVDVDCAVGRAPCLAADPSPGFVVSEAEVTFWGLCQDCSTTSATP
ncbi:MAG: Fur family transcriptional regulator [Nocardioidaceae bacterium]